MCWVHSRRCWRRVKGESAQTSYVASLYAFGTDAILKKNGEEATETVIVGKAGDDAAVIHEMADLWFHTLVLLSHRRLHPSAVLSELERRFGTSGHSEKAARGTTASNIESNDRG